MGSGGILWVSLGFWENPIGSGRILWGSTELWEDLWVPYGVWGNPMGLTGALGGPLSDLWGLGESYGGQRGSGRTSGCPMRSGGILWVSLGLWEDPMGVNGALGEPRGDLWGLGESYGSH